MSQKLTLARYLEGRGSVKSLTRIEAEAFGVPYPLVSGWPARHGDAEITEAMLRDLEKRAERANRSTARKARRGLDGVADRVASASYEESEGQKSKYVSGKISKPRLKDTFPGFALRRSLRRRSSTCNVDGIRSLASERAAHPKSLL